MKRPLQLALGGFGLTALSTAAHRTLRGSVADPDTFYHLGHARVYLDGSPFDTAFPWATTSAIGDLGADLWWGFHLLLVPFAGMEFGTASFAAGVALSTALLASLAWVAHERRWAWPWIWPVILLVAVPNVSYRLIMVRPHLVSLAGALVLLGALCGERRRRAAMASALVAWVHASLFWAPLLVAGAWAGAGLLSSLRTPSAEGAPAERGGRGNAWSAWWHRIRRPVAFVVMGVAAGLVLRPHPLSTMRLVGIQVLSLLAARMEGLDLSFGGELAPLPAAALFPSSWVLLLPWVLAMAFAAWRLAGMNTAKGGPTRRRARRPALEGAAVDHPPADVFLLASAILSALYLGLALFLSSRAMVEWAAFGTLAVAAAWNHAPTRTGVRRWLTGFTGLIALLALPWALSWHRLNIRLNALPADHLRQPAQWLAEHASDGDIVFHAHWDNFAPLFAWNRSTLYLGGMDPIFQFAHDEGLYWKHAHLAARGRPEATCGRPRCATSALVDTYTVLRTDFGARWVFLEPRRNPEFFEYLRRDPRYDLSLRTANEAVFEVLPVSQ